MTTTKPYKKPLSIRSTVYPDVCFDSFNKWINYIHREAERTRKEKIQSYFSLNKINSK